MNDRDDLKATVTTTPDGGVIVSTTGATTTAGELHLDIPQGATWTLYVTWKRSDMPQSFSGGTATFTARTAPGATALISLTAGSGITLGAQYATVSLTAAETAALAFTQAAYTFHVTLGGVTYPLLTGLVRLRKAV